MTDSAGCQTSAHKNRAQLKTNIDTLADKAPLEQQACVCWQRLGCTRFIDDAIVVGGPLYLLYCKRAVDASTVDRLALLIQPAH